MPLKVCSELLKKNESITIGPRQLYRLLRLTGIITDENYIVPPYDDMGYFSFEDMRILNPYGKRVAWHTKVLVSKKGYYFLVQHVKDNLDLITVKKRK